MKQKYFPLTFLGAGLVGALCGLIFCMVFLHVTGLDSPPAPPSSIGGRLAPSFHLHFDLIPASLCASVAAAVTSMFFWGLFILLPNHISVRSGVFTGLISTVCTIPLAEVFLDILHGSHMPFFTAELGLIEIVIVSLMSYGSVFLVGGVAGWLYVVLVRKVFALDVLPLLPPE